MKLNRAALIRSTEESVTVSTHVLDLGAGRPASGVRVELSAAGGGEPVASGETGADGRLRFEGEFAPGEYTLEFQVGGAVHRALTLRVSLDEERHYHLPLLVSPYGLSTYLGS